MFFLKDNNSKNSSGSIFTDSFEYSEKSVRPGNMLPMTMVAEIEVHLC